jgi:hypothetical protein
MLAEKLFFTAYPSLIKNHISCQKTNFYVKPRQYWIAWPGGFFIGEARKNTD